MLANMTNLVDPSRELYFTCCNDPEAVDFLVQWNHYVHAIDDLVDEELNSEDLLKTFARAIWLYTCPYFVKNMVALRQIAINTTIAYADTVIAEKSENKWEREFADSYRHFGAEMAIAVAGIQGGYEHARIVARELRQAAYIGHHDQKGNPV